jgi:hypothetical protein
VGVARPGRRGKVFLEPTNLAEILTPEFSRKQLRLPECTSDMKVHCTVD